MDLLLLYLSVCSTRIRSDYSSIQVYLFLQFFFPNKEQVRFHFMCENIWNSQTAMNRQQWRNYLLNHSNGLEKWPCKMSPTCSTLFISYQRFCTRRFQPIRQTRFVLEQDQSALPWNLMEYITIGRTTAVGVLFLFLVLSSFFVLFLFLIKSWVNITVFIVCCNYSSFYILTLVSKVQGYIKKDLQVC